MTLLVEGLLFISSDTRLPYKLPKGSVIQQITKNTTLHVDSKHDYIYFDDEKAPTKMKVGSTTSAIYTTLYKFVEGKEEDTLVGGSYYYTINDNGSVNVSRTD